MKTLGFILATVACTLARPDAIDPHRQGNSIGGLHKIPHVRGSNVLHGVDPHAGLSYGSATHDVVGKGVSYGSSSGSAVIHGAGYEGPKRVTVSHGSGYEGPKRVTVTHASGYDGPHRSSGYGPAIQSNSYDAPHQVSIHGDSGYGTPTYDEGYAKSPAQYEYGYGVSDNYHGTNFGHTESRDGYLTKGEYYVDLPDGRRQKVSYYVDEWGYHPTVTYEGEAQYPQYDNNPHVGGYQ